MTRPTVQILYTARRHFGAFSGIGQLTQHLDAKALDLRIQPVPESRAYAPQRWPWRVPQVRFLLEGALHRRGRPWYGAGDLAAEAAVLEPWLSGTIDVLHYLDGEHTARFLPRAGRLFRRSGRTVATFHQPLSILPDVVPARLIRSLDHLTVMSDSQRPYFTALVPQERVSVVHYGVDTIFFTPRQTPREPGPFRCLTTGSYLRDWTLLRAVADALRSRKDIQFHVVSAEAPDLDRLSNVVVHRAITDSELRNYYQSADLMVLPLRDATANNALLEGMACGLPVIASDLPAIREYAPSHAAARVPHHPEAFAAAIAQLMDDEAMRATMTAIARARAESLAWPLVARRYLNLYKNLAALRSDEPVI